MTAPASIWEDLAGDTPAASILDRIDAVWTAVWPKLSEMDARQMNEPLAGQEWCPRELMAHLAHWNDAHWFAVSEHLAARPVEIYDGWRKRNNAWFGNDRTVGADEASSRLQASHLRLRALLRSLAPDQWDEDIRAWILQCPLRHYREHLATLP